MHPPSSPPPLTFPSDFLPTSQPQLSTLDASARCQVCKDFYSTPMITSCAHTFCSLCIRRCLTADAKCPVCRAPDQEVRLRPNTALAEMVEAWMGVREGLLAVEGRKKRKRKEEGEGEGDGEKKRRKGREEEIEEEEGEEDGDDGSEVIEEDGLTACPICGRRMKEEKVFSHLDIHAEPENAAGYSSGTTANQRPSLRLISTSRRSKPPVRLPQLSYSLLKDTALRKKMDEIGIPSGGSRALLIRRHTEWVNLVNANCDSTRPRGKTELLHDLEVWDRSQSRHSQNGVANTASVMRKDFDGTAWAAAHDNEFQDLISKARQGLAEKATKHLPNVPHEDAGSQTPDDQVIGSPINQETKETPSTSLSPGQKPIP